MHEKKIHRLCKVAFNHLTIPVLQSCARDSPDGILSKINLFIYTSTFESDLLTSHPSDTNVFLSTVPKKRAVIRGRICRAGFRLHPVKAVTLHNTHML